VESKRSTIRRVKYWITAVAILASSGHSAPSSGDDFGIILVIGVVVLVGVVAGVINATKRPKRISPEKVKQLTAASNEFFEKLITTGKITAPDTSIVLATDETALLHEQSKLVEPRATRVYAGVGTRVKGIYIAAVNQLRFSI
jgi:hypothetical protein